jgi:beta-glucosidase
MKHSKTSLLLLIGGFSAIASRAQNAAPQLGKASVKEVIAAMTLEEKAHLVVGMGMRFGAPPPRRDSGNSRPAAASSGPVIGQTDVKVPGAAGSTFAIARLGIPSIVVADGPAGVRIDPIRNGDSSKTYYATAWPVATLLASSWDTALVRNVGAAFGNEVHEYGVDIILAPALNIHRNPLGGRNFEYYSEDPLIAGSMTSAMVNGIESNGVGTSIKHFAANNQETNRNTINTIVGQRALREIYLKGFQLAVERSQPWTVMSSYNKINGTYTSEERELLTTILRDEWDFKGLVMTDWFGGKDPVAQMKAGNDLLMPGTPNQVERIISAVQHDSLDIKVLDINIAHILNVILLSPSFKKYQYSDKPNLVQHAAVARKAAAESMVLLKNTAAALPVKKNASVALFGNTSYELIAGGTGSGDVNKKYTVSLVQGLSNAGYKVDAGLQNAYTTYISDEKIKHPKKSFFQEFMNPTPPIAEFVVDNDLLTKAATSNDMAFITIGRNAGEGRDRKLEGDYYLSDTEKVMIKNVADAFHAQHKKVAVVLNIGGVIDVTRWRDNVDAILLAWQPGLEGGNAIADVLSGVVDPSGKLATTFPADYKDVPSAKNFPGKEFPEQATTGNFGRKQIPAEVTYEDGIYVGYRYYNTFGVKPAYEFGYGLSYTTFNYSNLKLSSSNFNGSLTATVTVTNTGKVAGKEAVQLYLSAPAKKLDKPALELKSFAKTGLLQPGASQTLTFTLKANDLASFDPKQSAWIAEAGTYKVSVGASSQDMKQTGTFALSNDIVVEKDHDVLAPQVAVTELKKAF